MVKRKGLGQANILRTNNNTSTGYGIAYADEVSGHRTVGNLTALYALHDWQLSASGDNTDSDAIGQLWYVVNADGNGNGCYYQLKDWSKRNEAAGWSIADYTTKAELQDKIDNIATADEEDITTEGDTPQTQVLKLKDRTYDSLNASGKGYKILRKNWQTINGERKNVLTQEMINEPNTIYEIRYDFDLNGAEIQIKEGCVLNFVGGSFSNGIIEGNDTVIINNSNSHIFDNITLTGSFICDYFTPDWFGAVGDGVTDDTDKLAYALKMSNDLNYIPVKFLIGKKYYVTGPINYYKGELHDLVLNLVGDIRHKYHNYSVNILGGIKLANGTELFKGKTIGGAIQYLNIVGQRDESVHIFDNCICRGLIINRCIITNVGAVFYDTNLEALSEVKFSTFTTAFWFARNVETGSGMVDSTIHHNYINGGQESTENSCFMFGSYNGSTIHDNFIDYYRTIYMPTSKKSQTFGSIVSFGNEYQVFRYFFIRGNDNITAGNMNSTNDVFNWTDLEKLEQLKKYKALQYTGRDGNKYDIPPCIGYVYGNSHEVYRNVVIERNVGNILFVRSGLAEYSYSLFKFEVNNVMISDSVIQFPQGHTLSIYNGGAYPYIHNFYNVENVIERVDSLPTINLGWSARPIGHKVFYKNAIWKATLEYDKNTESYSVSWQPQN